MGVRVIGRVTEWMVRWLSVCACVLIERASV